jgi:small neutral amino acid transporter SnatA (MarC family)
MIQFCTQFPLVGLQIPLIFPGITSKLRTIVILVTLTQKRDKEKQRSKFIRSSAFAYLAAAILLFHFLYKILLKLQNF